MSGCKTLLLTLLFLGIESTASLTGVRAENGSSITIELNKAEPGDANCLLAFVVNNQTNSDIHKLAYEVVVFDKDERIDRMTVFDFQEIGAGKQRVRQFQLPDTSCQTVGKLLVNGVSSCETDHSDNRFCDDKLQLSTKSPIEFIN